MSTVVRRLFPGSVRERIGPFLGLAAVFVLFAAVGPSSFSSGGNLETIARQTAFVGIAAVGMTMVIIAGGIDLSVGSIIALVTVVVAALLQAGAPPVVAGIGGIIAGLLCGFVNGVLITRLRVVPFIVTLGTLLVIRGAAKGLAHEQKIDAPLTWLADLLAALPPESRWQIVPPGVWLTIVFALGVAVVLRSTRLGRHMFAVGSNEQTARLAGVAVDRVKVIVYALSGMFAGLAGVLQFSRLTVGDPTVAVGLELDVIAAVVIGGGSLSGGSGGITGSMIGAFLMSFLANGCTLTGVPNYVQEIIVGVIIVAAVAIDGARRRIQ